MKTLFGILFLVLGTSSVARAQLTLPYAAQCNNPNGGCFSMQNTNGGWGTAAVWGTTSGSATAVRGSIVNYGNGTGVHGDAGLSSGVGVYGSAQANGTGVYGGSYSGVGVYAVSFAGDALRATAVDPARSAVYGSNDGGGGWGGFFQSSGSGVGVHGRNTNTSGWAVYAEGRLYADTALKPGGGSWSMSSDARLKKDIKPLEGAVDKMLTLKGVTYEWIDPKTHGNLTGRQTGLVAQDVEKSAFASWVGTDGKGMKTITVRGFEAITVEAVRELEARIARLERREAALSLRRK